LSAHLHFLLALLLPATHQCHSLFLSQYTTRIWPFLCSSRLGPFSPSLNYTIPSPRRHFGQNPTVARPVLPVLVLVLRLARVTDTRPSTLYLLQYLTSPRGYASSSDLTLPPPDWKLFLPFDHPSDVWLAVLPFNFSSVCRKASCACFSFRLRLRLRLLRLRQRLRLFTADAAVPRE
ncbi:hypothetical protein CABS01_03355, partial [Colletotrichum abscissum]|uniref:uncharacterized protein n=1 Tax=Colletotrichum abscissum TaxID=1671311 RepID=UPI0027D53B48